MVVTAVIADWMKLMVMRILKASLLREVVSFVAGVVIKQLKARKLRVWIIRCRPTSLPNTSWRIVLTCRIVNSTRVASFSESVLEKNCKAAKKRAATNKRITTIRY
jgi:hypothetical protein